MYGDIKITLVKTETLAEYVVRTFALERVSLLLPWSLQGCLRRRGRVHLPTSQGRSRSSEEGSAVLPSRAGAPSLQGALWGDRTGTALAGDPRRTLRG